MVGPDNAVARGNICAATGGGANPKRIGHDVLALPVSEVPNRAENAGRTARPGGAPGKELRGIFAETAGAYAPGTDGNELIVEVLNAEEIPKIGEALRSDWPVDMIGRGAYQAMQARGHKSAVTVSDAGKAERVSIVHRGGPGGQVLRKEDCSS